MTARSARSRGVSWPLFLLCLGLGSWVYWALAESQDAWSPAGMAGAEAALEAEPSGGTSFALPALDDFSETIERPLFIASRRPIEAPAPVVAAPEPVGDAPAALRGVIISESDRSALLQVDKETNTVWVSEGASFGGWEVEQIQADRVTLRRGGETRTLLLKDETSPARPSRKTRRAKSQEAVAEEPEPKEAPQPKDSEPEAQ